MRHRADPGLASSELPVSRVISAGSWICIIFSYTFGLLYRRNREAASPISVEGQREFAELNSSPMPQKAQSIIQYSPVLIMGSYYHQTIFPGVSLLSSGTSGLFRR